MMLATSDATLEATSLGSAPSKIESTFVVAAAFAATAGVVAIDLAARHLVEQHLAIDLGVRRRQAQRHAT